MGEGSGRIASDEPGEFERFYKGHPYKGVAFYQDKDRAQWLVKRIRGKFQVKATAVVIRRQAGSACLLLLDRDLPPEKLQEIKEWIEHEDLTNPEGHKRYLEEFGPHRKTGVQFVHEDQDGRKGRGKK